MRILRARILEAMAQTEAKRLSSARKIQIGTGDRSEKIRTYNFPDRRITDHRINFTTHQLEAVLEGQMDELSDALIKAEEDKLNEPRTFWKLQKIINEYKYNGGGGMNRKEGAGWTKLN